MKLYNLIQVKNTFASHYNEKLSAGLSYKIYKLCNSIEQEEQFFNQKKQAIIEEFGQKDANGQFVVDDNGFVKIIDGKEPDAQRALDDLTSVDVEIPNVAFTIDELSEIKLSVRDMAVLEELIVGE